MNRIEGGDLIIDTPTRINEDGTKEVSYYFMAKEWPSLKEGATIYIDGDKLGPVKLIRFRNTSDGQSPWTIKSAKVVNIGKVVAGCISIHGLLNLELNGTSDALPGLTKWAPGRVYTTGYFGFHVINSEMFNGHGIDVSVLHGGSIKLHGFEIQYGFSGVRIQSAPLPTIVESVDISNFYIHDICKGEGFYIGSTYATGELPTFRNLKIKNGFIARTGAEALQLQHLIGNADVADIVIYAADTGWINAFQPGQDTGIQWVNANGENRMSNIILDGYGSMALAPFGSIQATPNNAVSKVNNMLFNDGAFRGMYLHNSAVNGVKWEYDNLYFRQFNSGFDEVNKKANHIISKKHGTDPVSFIKLTHDGSKEKVFEDATNIDVGDVVLDLNMPYPSYVNSGFHESASCIRRWHPTYAPYFPSGPIPTQWEAGNIAIEITDTDYKFYKCVQSHTSTATPPSKCGNFTLLTWDINGTRSDQIGYKNEGVSFFPPDDLRLEKNSYWDKKGFGVKSVVEKEIILEEWYFDGKRYTKTDKNLYVN